MDMYLRRISEDEIEETYTLYLEVFEWLRSKGIVQWLVPISEAQFRQRQSRGEIFALIMGDNISAIATLSKEVHNEWVADMPAGAHWWMKSLAVKRDFAGTGIGRQMMAECEKRIAGHGGEELYLDCVDGSMLDKLYTELGYETIARRHIPHGAVEPFHMVLMRKLLPANAALRHNALLAMSES
jgi:ribosomal protein S18 acetylase RimI-like enzyme